MKMRVLPHLEGTLQSKWTCHRTINHPGIVQFRLYHRRFALKHWAYTVCQSGQGARTMSTGFPRRNVPEPSVIGRLRSFSNSALQCASQEHSKWWNSWVSPDTEYLSIAATTSESHEPQLWAPRIFPPAVGCTMIRQLGSTRCSWARLIISTNDHSHGVLYSLFLKSLSTTVFF